MNIQTSHDVAKLEMTMDDFVEYMLQIQDEALKLQQEETKKWWNLNSKTPNQNG